MPLINYLFCLKGFSIAIVVTVLAHVGAEESFQNYQELKERAKEELEGSLNSRIDVVKRLSTSVLSGPPKEVRAEMRGAIFEGYNIAVNAGFINGVKWQAASEGDLAATGMDVETFLLACVAVSDEYGELMDYMALTGSAMDDVFSVLLRIEDLTTIPDQWVQQAELSVIFMNAHAIAPRRVGDPLRRIWIDYETEHRDAFLVKMASTKRLDPSRLAELLIAPNSRLDEVYRQERFTDFYQIINNLLSVDGISSEVVRHLSEKMVLKYEDEKLVKIAQIFLSEIKRESGAIYDVGQVASFAERLGKPLFAEALRTGMKEREAGW